MKSAIEINGLSFEYEKGKPVLQDVSVRVAPASITVLLGKNGSGKSTLIDCIIGFHSFQKGTVTLNGFNLKDLSERQIAQNVAYVPQTIGSTVDFSVLDFITFGRNCWLNVAQRLKEQDWESARANAEKCGLGSLLHQSINKLSGGERQLAYIARALTQDAPIIVMDEPLSSLDVANQQTVLQMIKTIAAEGKTVLLSSHNPNHALNLDADVCLLNDGRVEGFGKAQEMVTPEILGPVYGEQVCFSNELPYQEISFTR